MLRYHDITTDDMKNGPGLRVVLWLAGCDHHCKGCQNPITWDPDGGLPVTAKTLGELWDKLKEPYISGLTLSGGDPLYMCSRDGVYWLCRNFKHDFPDKTIWMYTGYDYEDVKDLPVMAYVDVLVDGKFVESMADINYEWAGSTNQRIIDIPKSKKYSCAIKYKN